MSRLPLLHPGILLLRCVSPPLLPSIHREHLEQLVAHRLGLDVETQHGS